MKSVNEIAKRFNEIIKTNTEILEILEEEKNNLPKGEYIGGVINKLINGVTASTLAWVLDRPDAEDIEKREKEMEIKVLDIIRNPTNKQENL